MYPVVPQPAGIFLGTGLFFLFCLLYFLTPPPSDL